MRSFSKIINLHYFKSIISSPLSYIFAENFDLINRLIKKYSCFARIWLGPELNVVVTDPNDVEVSENIKSQTDFVEKLADAQKLCPDPEHKSDHRRRHDEKELNTNCTQQMTKIGLYHI